MFRAAKPRRRPASILNSSEVSFVTLAAKRSVWIVEPHEALWKSTPSAFLLGARHRVTHLAALEVHAAIARFASPGGREAVRERASEAGLSITEHRRHVPCIQQFH